MEVEKLVNLTLDSFSESVASSSPAPGGGSVAAYAGALGVSLGQMVYRINKVENKEIIEKLEHLRLSFIELVDEDTNAFKSVMTAYKLPKNTDSEKALRRHRIEEAIKDATLVPLRTARNCRQAMVLLKELALLKDRNTASDLSVGNFMISAALLGAISNVEINLKSLKDFKYKEKIAHEKDKLFAEGRAYYQEINFIIKELLA